MDLFLPSMGMYVVWQVAYLFITGKFSFIVHTFLSPTIRSTNSATISKINVFVIFQRCIMARCSTPTPRS